MKVTRSSLGATGTATFSIPCANCYPRKCSKEGYIRVVSIVGAYDVTALRIVMDTNFWSHFQ